MVTKGPVTAPSSRWFWLRWSWRDLRAHWAAVIAIALVMAIGTGVYAGLGSSATWREVSNDASFAALEMHDVRVELSPGTFIDQGALRAAVAESDVSATVLSLEERLVVASQIDASTDEASILVAARLVGMDVEGSEVDRIWVRDAGPSPAQSPSQDTGLRTTAVLEAKFADAWDLPTSGSITVGGNHRLAYSGLGVIPEDFFYQGPEGSILSQGELAPVYLPLEAAQEITGRAEQVNDLVIRLQEGTDGQSVADELTDVMANLGVSSTITTGDEAEAVRVLYDDIDNDQRFWNAISALILGAAALASFNLISRIVEAQRREIGIGMALGVPRRFLAIRPLLIGFQVALLGTAGGIGVGLLMGQAMGDLLESFLPLPNHQTPFQIGVFAQAALLGLLIPILAAAIPVWRAVRVEPIEAIRTGHLNAKTSRLTDWTGKLPIPGSSLTQMPIRNVLRTPRRTLLTAMGVGASIISLVAVLGMLDSFTRTIDDLGAELEQGEPDRILVQLDTFHAGDGEVVGAVADAASVGRVDPALRLPATASAAGSTEEIDLLVELIDFDTAAWSPTILDSSTEANAGLVVARKAAADLGASLGDVITLRHLELQPDGSFITAQSDLTVTAFHANPLRTFAFLDLAQADRFGLSAHTNLLHVLPAEAATRADVQREVFGLPGVTSSQAVGRIGESFDETLAQFVSILVLTAAFVLVLAVLIAFNASRITVDERRREHATMRAFGLPVRSIMGVVVKESVLIGLAATVIGIVGGSIFLQWMLSSLAETTLPDIGMVRYLSPATLGIAAVVGVVAVSVAPLFLTRRITSMDIPDTLRVME